MITELSESQLNTLIVINKVYSQTGNGCHSVLISTQKSELDLLEENEFIFKAKGVYFPSTKGQEYLKNKTIWQAQ